MYSILITILIFLVAFFVQLLLVRIFRKLHVHPFVSFMIYIGGLLIVVPEVVRLGELPYTSILVYILLTLLLMTVSFVPLLGQRSPASVIMTILGQKPVELVTLENAFDEKAMILSRLEDLVRVGLVYKRGQRYIISPIGSYIARFISVLCTLTGLKMRG